MKLTRIAAGVYASPSGKYQVVKDGYEPVRDWTPDKRVSLMRAPGGGDLYLGAEEVCWVVVNMHLGQDGTNEIIVDTLREAREWLSRQEDA